MILSFDMDDTLYDEMTFVRSGFMAVARHLHASVGAPVQECYEWMLAELARNGRGRIFDAVLARYDSPSKKKFAHA